MPCRAVLDHDHVPSAAHRLICRECRRGAEADAMMRLTVACMRAQAPPKEGVERVLRTLALDGLSPVRITERRVIAAQRHAVRAAKAFAALTGALLVWLWWIDIDPRVSVPAPPGPSPNAYTYFRDAGRALVHDREIDAAFSLAYPREVSKPASGPPTGSIQKRVLTDDQLVAANVEALALLRRGLAYKYQDPPVRSFSQTLPHYASYRKLARLLALESAVRARRGDPGRAVQSALDATALGVMCPRGSGMIGRLVGLACESIGRQALEQVVGRLDEPTARAAAQRLDSIAKKRTAISETFTEELWAGVAGLQEIMSKPRWRWGLAQLLTSTDSDTGSLPRLAAAVASVPFSKGAIIGSYMRLSQAQAARGVLPYPQKAAPSEAPDGAGFISWLVPTFSQALVRSDANDALSHLMLVRLAMQAYRSRHHCLPLSLQDLVTDGLIREVPRDPFGDATAPVRYVRRGAEAVIYCVGPDGRDDGGVPATNASASGSNTDRYAINGQSVGDVVAGVSH